MSRVMTTPPPVPPENSSTNQFAELLAAAIAQRGLTLARIQSRLAEAGVPVSVATLSYWASGRSRPTRNNSLEVVRVLEKILQVPAGTLSRALAMDQKLHDLGTLIGEPDELQKLVEQLGLPGIYLGRRILVEFTTYLDEHDAESETLTTQVAQPEGAAVDSWVFAIQPDPPRDVRVEAVTGLEVRRHHQLPGGLLVVEVAPPQPLKRGETLFSRHRTVFGPGAGPAREAGYAVTRRTEVLVLEVVFGGRLPSMVRRVFTSPDGESDLVTRQGVQIEGNTAHCVIAPALPGVHYLAWDW